MLILNFTYFKWSRIIIIIIFLFILLSCNKRRPSNASSEDIEIIINDTTPCLKGEDLIKEVFYVPLQSSEDIVIQSLGRILFDDDLIFIVDPSQSVIFVYDFNGKPRCKIGHAGSGPGEYIRLSEVTIDSEKNVLNIYDEGSRKMISIDYNGKFVEEIKMPTKGILFYVVKVPGEDRFIAESFDFRKEILFSFDKKRNLHQSALKVPYQESFGFFTKTNRGSHFMIHQNDIYYSSIFDNAIYRYRKNEFQKIYSYNLDKTRTLSSLKKVDYNNRPSFEAIYNYAQQGFITDIRNLVISDDYVTFFLDGGKYRHYNVLFNRHTHQTVFYEGLLMEAGIKQPYQPPFLCSYKDFLVYVVNWEAGIEYLRTNKKLNIKDVQQPVLCFVKI